MGSSSKKRTPPNWPLMAWALFALAIAVALPWILPSSLAPQTAPRKPSDAGEVSPITIPQSPDAQKPQQKKTESIETWVQQESEKVGLINDSPEETLQQMQQRSTSLTEEEIHKLLRLVLNDHQNGDQRFFSVELLAMNTSEASTAALEKISTQAQPQGSLQSSMQSSLELALRARAIEGLGHSGRPNGEEALGRVLSKVDDQFLVDRAERSRLAHQGLVPSPEKQDHDTLNKVLQSQSN